MFRVLGVLLLTVFVSVPAFGADGASNFYIGGGAGGVTCPNFVSAMEKARSQGVGTVDFANTTQGFTMYVLGFESGYNMGKPSTYDIFPNKSSVYPLLNWVENWCRVHPGASFGAGVVALANAHYAGRQQVAPVE